jgi:TonB family protein
MVDSTAAYERGPDGPSFSLLSGDRTRPATGQGSDGIEGAGAEHFTALLKMGALTLEAGGYSDAEDLFRRALKIGESAFGTESPALVPAMTSLASARIMSGKFEDAEPLVVRALAVSDTGLAEHDPDLAIVLNDLARLCLKQSAYALAEPLLLRMLALKRSKGEDHPEVATVLASLATVRQALGRHESAEQLWRRVLEIRERTLAPNHFALATALERLGEACTARGKIGEALQLFKRAEVMRELTLGAGHASLRVSRDRIADLQLQAEGSLDPTVQEAPPAAPERQRLLSAESNSVSSHQTARDRSAPASRKGTARLIEREAPPRVVEREAPPRAVEREAPPRAVEREALPRVVERESTVTADLVLAPPASVLEVPVASPRPAEPAPADYRDVIMSIHQELDDDEGDEDQEETAVPSRRATEILASAVAGLKQRQQATVVGVAAIGLLIVLATVARGWSEPPASASEISPAAAIGSTVTPAAEGSGGPPVPTKPERAAATAAAGATPVATPSHSRIADRTTEKKTPDRKPEPSRILIPKVSPNLTTNFDSVVLARSTATPDADQSIAAQLEKGSGKPLIFERDEPVNTPQRAQLIGSLPAPKYPAQLRNLQGEVQVRFQVDTMGRPVVSSISVVRSSDALFTAATLKVIPGLRFEPARTGGADSKAAVDVVQIGFQFRPVK